MPPPSSSSKVSQTSKDRESDCDCECSKNICPDESAVDLKRETVKYMKTLLGPSLEDAVLKTIEFGRTIINKKQVLSDLRIPTKEDKLLDVLRKEVAGSNSKNGLDLDYIFSEGQKIMREQNAKKKQEKCVGIKTKMEKNVSYYEKPPAKKFSNVSKIRSLDSDLKHDASTPEKIKRQLEALIQINKVNKQSEPECKRGGKWNLGLSAPKFPVEMTIMPSICMYKNETDMNCPCNGNEITSKEEPCEVKSDCDRVEEKKTCSSKISQAPEFISNALGPTLDVSIIDNLMMMRDLFKSDSAKGETIQKPCSVKQEVRLQNSEMEMNCRIVALQKKIEELELKEQCLARQIEDEENERNCKRKAFEEEEKKIFSVRSCFDKISVRSKKENSEANNLECNLEALKLKIACEEEKLMKLKNESECFKRELAEVRSRKQNLKRNKSLLDAWDVFASRICHTRLPSFSRAICLERKQFGAGETENWHCCFPLLAKESAQCNKGPKNCGSRSGISDTLFGSQSICQNTLRSQSRVPSPCSNPRASCSEVSASCSKDKRLESQSTLLCKIKMGEIQFPVQRDVTCGMHQVLKTCTCRSTNVRREGHLCSSDDDLMRKMRNMKAKCEHQNSFKIPSFSSNKAICPSKSDTSMRRSTCSKIVKVMWATTRINVFQDNSRTYEVMDATSSPPACLPMKTEGIFVVKNSQQKVCPSSKNCPPCVSEY